MADKKELQEVLARWHGHKAVVDVQQPNGGVFGGVFGGFLDTLAIHDGYLVKQVSCYTVTETAFRLENILVLVEKPDRLEITLE